MTARISFNQFMEFVSASGSAKLSKVRHDIAMFQTDYKKSDWWLELKHAVTECLTTGDLTVLDRCLDDIRDERKISGYTANLIGLRRWIGRKRMDPFDVPRRIWSAAGLEVSVKPELGLMIKGERHVVKLYFKEDPLDQRQVNPLLALMQKTHGEIGKACIIDCRRGKAFFVTTKLKDVDALLEAEARAYLHLWHSLTRPEGETG